MYIYIKYLSTSRAHTHEKDVIQLEIVTAAPMEFRRGGNGTVGGNKGYNKKRNQQRNTQPIYQPPAQRGHTSMPINSQNNIQHNSFL